MNVSVFFQVIGVFAGICLVFAGIVGAGMWIEKHVGLWQSIVIVGGAVIVGIAAMIACIQ